MDRQATLAAVPTPPWHDLDLPREDTAEFGAGVETPRGAEMPTLMLDHLERSTPACLPSAAGLSTSAYRSPTHAKDVAFYAEDLGDLDGAAAGDDPPLIALAPDSPTAQHSDPPTPGSGNSSLHFFASRTDELAIASPLLTADLDQAFERRPIGHGRFGSVYATSTTSCPRSAAVSPQADAQANTPSEIAIKTVQCESNKVASSEIAFVRRAFAVGETSGAAVWRNIVEVVEAAHDPVACTTSVVMELMSGGCVAQHAAFRATHPDEAPGDSAAETAAREERLRRVARDVSAGLRVLHDELRVVHRDIKPENVLLAADGTAKLADFGVAAVLGAGQDAATDQQGTTVFMSPERLRGEAHGPASDVWALGVTLLQLALRGRHPFVGAGAGSTERFWQLAEVLHHTRSLEECERATTAAVEKALAEAGLSAGFGAFVRSCLVADAGARLPASALLLHPWLSSRM